MLTSEFDYSLPQELIAQTPLAQRDASRMLYLDRRTGALQHRHFTDLCDYLAPGDCLVINLPGSRGGVKDGLGVLGPVLRHAVEQVVGSDH